MPTYDGPAVSDAVFAHSRGATVKQARQLRDNPLAIAEASTGAPVVKTAWHWFDQTNVDDGSDGLVYDHAVDGNVSIIETPAFVRGFDYEVQFSLDLTVSGDREFRIQTQSGETGSWRTIYTRAYNAILGSPEPIWAVYRFERPMAGPEILKTVEGRGIVFSAAARPQDYGTISGFRLSVDGVFDGGTFRMMHRREYVSQ